MADQKQLDLLRQGVETWNAWRGQHKLESIDLSGAVLSDTDLTDANLRGAVLSDTDLTGANLSGANLHITDLREANLTRAVLDTANLSEAHLREANLSYTVLYAANLTRAGLYRADLREAVIGQTIFGDVDLRTVIGLETVTHFAPSTIGTDTISRSEGTIPEMFLRKAGVTESFITYAHALTQNPIEYYTCFISYSSKDQEFTERLYTDLQSKHVRCWFAPEDLKIGEKFWHRIDESIRVYDKLLVVLSEHSVNSEWVEREVMAALEKEQRSHKTALFPITLDETVKQTSLPWAANIRRARHIGDFSHWKDHDAYQRGLKRLLRDLQPDTPPTNTS